MSRGGEESREVQRCNGGPDHKRCLYHYKDFGFERNGEPLKGFEQQRNMN